MTAPIKGAARIASDGKVTQLGPKATPDEVITEDDVKDTSKLVKLLVRILATIATLRRTWVPRRIDFEDQAVVAFTSSSFTHNFNGRVRWWFVDWNGPATAPAAITNATLTTTNLLVLDMYATGTVTVRVEEAG